MDNPGLRCIVKIAINCLFGKLGQRGNLPTTEVFNEVEPFINTVFDPTLNILNFCEIGEKAIVTCEKKEIYSDIKSPNTNVILAGYITSHARVKLYRTLDQLGDRVCYYDTDSVMFISRPGEEEPELGDRLGDWKSELSENNHITTFIAGGCKNYALKLLHPEKGKDTITVLKGFNLHWKNSKEINFYNIQKLVHDYIQNASDNKSLTVLEKDSFVRNKVNPGIFVRDTTKRYRILIDKRVLTENYMTYPFGYKKLANLLTE